MLKGYYIHFGADRLVGVSKKIRMQIKELQKHFQIEEINVPKQNRSLLRKVYDVIPFVMSSKYNFEEVWKKIDNPDFLYVRATWSDNQYMDFFRRMREAYPKCKIIIELPTYPYDKEVQKILFPRVWWSRRKYKKYIDCFTTYSKDKEIFGVPAISIENGIDVDSVKKVEGELEPGKIRLVAVSAMIKNHGYERVLNGLGDYYEKGGDRDIRIFMVGNGPERHYYESIVRKRNLQNKVVFYGQKTGEELDAIYAISDIALTVFGFYKINVYRMSALKTREYLAKGLPIVNGCVVDIFEDESCEYSYDFPNDDSVIDIENIVDFYDKIYENDSKASVSSKIRKMAYEKVDMSVVMRPIIEFIMGA